MKHFCNRLGSAIALATLAALGTASAQAPAPASSAIYSQPALPRPALERQEIRAQLMPRRYTTIAAEIGAKIKIIPTAEGEAFSEGQLLISFDCSIQRAQLEKANAELDAAEQTLKANVLLASLNSVGQLELDLSRSAMGRAKAEVGGNLAVLAKCDVISPFSGRIAEQRVREQQYVQPGQALLDIIDDGALELEFLVPSRWLTWIKAGRAFKISIDETRKSYPAKFIRIGARVDPVNQSVKVAAAIEGSFPELIAGMSGRIALTATDGSR
jgi:RND family efflux transporter MFP subunit